MHNNENSLDQCYGPCNEGQLSWGNHLKEISGQLHAHH